VTSKQHYASDAFVGSALGWYFGRQIYRARHDPGLGGTAWGSSAPNSETGEPRRKTPASPDVPLDSWVYPAIERLAAYAALVAVPTMIVGIYGMNFEHMPELKWSFGYPLVMAVMVAIDGYLFYRFRRAGWL